MSRPPLLLRLAAVGLVGCSSAFVAPTPNPGRVPTSTLPGTVHVTVQGVRDERECAYAYPLSFCVSGVKSALAAGLGTLAVNYSGPGGGDFLLAFKVLEMRPAPVSRDAQRNPVGQTYTITWELAVLDPDRQSLASDAATSTSAALGEESEAATFLGLEEEILARAALALDEAVAKQKARAAQRP